MNHIGISCNFHDAGMSVVSDTGEILFAGHSERYSKYKHDKDLCMGIVKDAARYYSGHRGPYKVNYYEKPWLKAIRQLRAGQSIGPLSKKELIGSEILESLKNPKIYTHGHHNCHAAAGFQTSTFKDATVVIIDAIGELDTISIWDARYDDDGRAQYKKLWSRSYPDSIGLFYSAITDYVGLKPLDEEYILMGMAAYGKPRYIDYFRQSLIADENELLFKKNLHVGLEEDFLIDADEMDIASTAQVVTERLISLVMERARKIGKSSNLVYGGGVALNCLANRLIGEYFDKIWIMPNPGDAGNSLGAAALSYGKQLQWKNAFLGYDIVGPYPVEKLVKELKENQIAGVANGRAEFGPRALGNRSLLADPRGPHIKDRVNEIKRRQKFRPFAPVILEEFVHDYFIMPRNWDDSRYMQVIATCKYPESFPAIVHADGTSRVQTVPKDGSGIRKLLERWYHATGCPMLLNTSLNIRGEPMVNDIADAYRFEKTYNIKVLS